MLLATSRIIDTVYMTPFYLPASKPGFDFQADTLSYGEVYSARKRVAVDEVKRGESIEMRFSNVMSFKIHEFYSNTVLLIKGNRSRLKRIYAFLEEEIPAEESREHLVAKLRQKRAITAGFCFTKQTPERADPTFHVWATILNILDLVLYFLIRHFWSSAGFTVQTIILSYQFILQVRE